MIKIGLIGHSFCCLNLGLGALTAGEIYCIKEACKQLDIEADITCYETRVDNPYSLEGYREQVNLKEYNIKHIFENIKNFKEQDIIFDITGGDSFSDIYGNKLYVVQMFIKTAIMLSGKKYIVAPQTIGPFSKKWAEIFANIFIGKAAIVFSRDKISADCLSKANSKRVINVVDLGFSMPYQKMDKRQKFTVGFNVSGLLYQSDRLVNGVIDYKKLCDEIIIFLKNKGYDIILVPHVAGKDDRGVDNDTGVCLLLAKKHQVEMAPVFVDPIQAKNYISQCDFFIGSRMHATIGAVSGGVPTYR